jgi:hypothetical protein
MAVSVPAVETAAKPAPPSESDASPPASRADKPAAAKEADAPADPPKPD